MNDAPTVTLEDLAQQVAALTAQVAQIEVDIAKIRKILRYEC